MTTATVTTETETETPPHPDPVNPSATPTSEDDVRVGGELALRLLASARWRQ